MLLDHEGNDFDDDDEDDNDVDDKTASGIEKTQTAI